MPHIHVWIVTILSLKFGITPPPSSQSGSPRAQKSRLGKGGGVYSRTSQISDPLEKSRLGKGGGGYSRTSRISDPPAQSRLGNKKSGPQGNTVASFGFQNPSKT